MLVIKIIRNIAVGVFMLISGCNLWISVNAQADLMETRYEKVDRNIVSYEVKRVKTTKFSSSLIGYFTTTEGETFLCYDTSDLAKNDPYKSYEKGLVSFWLRRGSRENKIYQVETDKGMILTYMDTVNDEAPKPLGPYLLVGMGFLFTITGLYAALYYHKQEEAEQANEPI